MKKLEITKGEWSVFPNSLKGKNQGFDIVTITANGEWNKWVASALHANVTDGSEKQSSDNATLIADAGNTYQQCELLPSELLELYGATADVALKMTKESKALRKQRDDLLEACSELLGLLKFHGYEHATEIYKANEALKNSKP